jgi:phosphotriesterase-related protein
MPATGFVRTVLGDIDPSELGITYAHEHLVIRPSRTTELFPDFRLDDLDRAVDELAGATALGLRTVVDAMPADAGRDAELLAAVSRRASVHVIAPTGAHHARFYPPGHWTETLPVEQIAALFAADITEGIDRQDYGGPIVERTGHRAGVIKLAGSTDGPSDRDARIFEAGAIAHAATGCPILTHCEAGTGAIQQVELLGRHRIPAGHVALSHVDRVVDRGYQRDVFATGAFVEYDQGFRWGDQPNGTLTLLEWAAEDGWLGQVLLGLDAARQGYWSAYGGTPGWTFLLGEFTAAMAERGLGDAEREQLFVVNPARWLAFAPVG